MVPAKTIYLYAIQLKMQELLPPSKIVGILALDFIKGVQKRSKAFSAAIRLDTTVSILNFALI